MGLNGIAIAGGIGQGISQGLADKRAMDEADQMKQLRAMQLDQLKQDQEYSKSLKGLKRVGSPTYDGSFQGQGAGVDQAKALDAQTADFGPEGAQATADALAGAKGLSKAPPVKSIPYSAGNQAADISQLALQAGKPDVAATYADRAFTLNARDVQDRTNQFIRALPGMSLQDASKALAQLHTADSTPYAAFMKATPDNPDGLPEVTTFDRETGKSVTHMVKDKNELAMFAQSLVDHNARHEMSKQQMQLGTLGIQSLSAQASMKGANAQEYKAETDRQEFNAKKDAGVFTATADHFKAQSESLRTSAPAQAELARSHAQYYNQLGQEMRAKAGSFESKLGDAEKTFLAILKENAMAATKASVMDPSPQNKDAAMSAKFQLAMQLSQFGAKDFDPYAMSGVPRPEVAAATLMSAKPNPKDLAAAVQNATNRFGMDYGTTLKKAVDAKLAETAKVSTSNSIGTAPSMTPRGIQAPGVLDRAGRDKYLAEQGAAKKAREEAANASIAGPMSEWEKKVMANPNAPAGR